MLTEILEEEMSLPDVFSFNSVIGAYGNSGMILEMKKWFVECQLMGIKPNVMTFNILIKSYGKAGMYDKKGYAMEYMSDRFIPTTPLLSTYLLKHLKGREISRKWRSFS
ncbi:hypothetical protein R6Q57_001571 [Mikania cordata]